MKGTLWIAVFCLISVSLSGYIVWASIQIMQAAQETTEMVQRIQAVILEIERLQ